MPTFRYHGTRRTEPGTETRPASRILRRVEAWAQECPFTESNESGRCRGAGGRPEETRTSAQKYRFRGSR
ncbi:hypothetical protein VTG60DRAFT_2714 [Thermothelomyces hinnuleus]